MGFTTKLDNAVTKNNSLLCVGLDPDISKLPDHLKGEANPSLAFTKAIIDATCELVCAYKPNSAFYEARGAVGIEELKQTCDYIHAKCPDVPIILDFKRGDIGNTNQNYAIFAFDYIGADAITVQPYLGKEAVQAFLDYKDKGIMVLCRTSNPGSGELQDLEVNGRKLYQVLAQNVKDSWNENGNCQLVVGATYPDELSEVRKIVGEDMVLLVPGVGAQGADIEATLKAGINKSGRGIIVNSGRDILYASSGTDFAEAAKKRAQETRDEINKYRKKG